MVHFIEMSPNWVTASMGKDYIRCCSVRKVHASKAGGEKVPRGVEFGLELKDEQ